MSKPKARPTTPLRSRIRSACVDADEDVRAQEQAVVPRRDDDVATLLRDVGVVELDLEVDEVW